jgi:hypothetical protein
VIERGNLVAWRYPDSVGSMKMVDYPASYHNGAGCFSYADGRAEMKRWRDPRTTPTLNYATELSLVNNSMPNNQDVFWLQYHSTRPNNLLEIEIQLAEASKFRLYSL